MNENKSNFGSIARMNTLKPEEMEEAMQQAEAFEEAEENDITDSCEDVGCAEPEAEAGHVYEEEKPKRLAHSEPVITATARPTKDDMYRFMFRHTYVSPVGVLAVLIGIGAIAMVVMSLRSGSTLQIIMFVIVALLFLVNSPISLIFKAKRHSAAVCAPEGLITYGFSDAGLDMKRGKDYAAYNWSHVYKVIEGKTGFYIYLSKNQAFVMPKADLGSEVDNFRRLLKRNVEKRCHVQEEEQVKV